MCEEEDFEELNCQGLSPNSIPSQQNQVSQLFTCQFGGQLSQLDESSIILDCNNGIVMN
jgi:hypothetical protein